MQEARAGSRHWRGFFSVGSVRSCDAAASAGRLTASASSVAASAAERQGALPDTRAASQSELRCDSSGAVPLAACRVPSSAPTAGAGSCNVPTGCTASPDGAAVSGLTFVGCAGLSAASTASACWRAGAGARAACEPLSASCCAGRTLKTATSVAALLTKRPVQWCFGCSGLAASAPHRVVCLSIASSGVCSNGATTTSPLSVLRCGRSASEASTAGCAAAAGSTCRAAAVAGAAVSATCRSLSADSRRPSGPDRAAPGSATPAAGCAAAADVGFVVTAAAMLVSDGTYVNSAILAQLTGP